MRHIVNILLVAVGTAMFVTSCGEKKKTEEIITERVVPVKSSGPIQMQENTDERDVEWIGKTYHVKIHRQPSDSLFMVKDETGQCFVDNIFTVTISRSDGSVFFKRQFTKAFFAAHITDDFRKTGILEGLVFDKADGDWLEFAGSVGHPQTDEYIPLILRLSRMGALEVRQDTQLDTSATDEEDEV